MGIVEGALSAIPAIDLHVEWRGFPQPMTDTQHKDLPKKPTDPLFGINVETYGDAGLSLSLPLTLVCLPLGSQKTSYSSFAHFSANCLFFSPPPV